MSQQAPQQHSVLNLSTIFSRTIGIYKVAFKPLFVVSFVMACCNQFTQLYVQQFLHLTGDKITLDSPVKILSAMIMMALVMIVFNAILFMQCAGAQLGRSTKLKYLLSHIWQSFPALLLASILFFMLLAAGLSLFVFPAVIVAVFCYIYMPIILFDGAPAMSAIQRSFHLVKPYFSYVLLYVFISLFLQYGPLYIIARAFDSQVGQSGFGVAEMLIIFVTAIIYPFIISLCLQVYFALKRLSAGL